MLTSSKFIKRASLASKAARTVSGSLQAACTTPCAVKRANGAFNARQFSSAVRPAPRGAISANKHAQRLLSSTRKLLHETVESGTLSSPSDMARKLSEAVLPRIPRPDVKKVLVVGSGGLSIGQAGEFDYSGESMPDLSQKSGASLWTQR